MQETPAKLLALYSEPHHNYIGYCELYIYKNFFHIANFGKQEFNAESLNNLTKQAEIIRVNNRGLQSELVKAHRMEIDVLERISQLRLLLTSNSIIWENGTDKKLKVLLNKITLDQKDIAPEMGAVCLCLKNRNLLKQNRLPS